MRHLAGRSLAVVALAGVHLLVLLQLFSVRPPVRSVASVGLAVRFIPAPAPLPKHDLPPLPAPTQPERRAPRVTPPADETTNSPSEPTPPVAPLVDWRAEAQRAAAAAVDEPSVQKPFGPRAQAPLAAQPKPFGWDKTHTERVQALPEGGILVRLSDNCAMVIAPLPLVGCSLGKRKARGDLFDGMKEAPRPGDWKDAEGVP
jgi:hypothetical protein